MPDKIALVFDTNFIIRNQELDKVLQHRTPILIWSMLTVLICFDPERPLALIFLVCCRYLLFLKSDKRVSSWRCTRITFTGATYLHLYYIMPCQMYKEYNLRIMSSPYINNVGTQSHWFPYRETQFFEFDKYLFANWSRTKSYEEALSRLE